MMIYSQLFNKKSISIFILILINFIFSVKYFSRYTDSPVLVATFLSIAYLIILVFLFSSNLKDVRIFRYFNVFILLLFLLSSIFVFSIIEVNSLNVDRWSIITNFWDAFFNGEYSYFSTSNAGNPPGPMPFYFILALPFYYVGELGYFSLSGILLMYFLGRYLNLFHIKLFLTLLFISLSTFYLWEIVTRSNVFINSTLILFSIVYFERFQEFNTKKILLSSVIVGCLLSTRNIFAISYIIYFMFLLLSKKISFKELVSVTLLSIFFFACTFLPFVIGHFEKFFDMNPFLVQSTFLIPFGYTVLFLLIAFISSFFVKSFEDAIFCIGINLFISILIYSIYLIVERGFYEAYYESVIDISYFIFCVPFFLLAPIIKSFKRGTATITVVSQNKVT